MRQLKTLRQMIVLFGMVNGAIAFLIRVREHCVKSSHPIQRRMRVRGIPHPIAFRPGTSDWNAIAQVFDEQEYAIPSKEHDQSIDNFYERCVAQGLRPLIIDCGGNIGAASIWFALRFPLAKVIAIEPEALNCRLLSENIARYPSVEVRCGGISNRKTNMKLSNVGDAPWAWETTEDETGEIETYTIPDLLLENPSCCLMIVKIDIEGSEVALFRSNISWIEDAPLIIFEAHDWLFHWRGTSHAILSALTIAPRDYLQHGENTFSFSHSLLHS